MEYRFSAPLWMWSGEAAWWFVTLPFEIADEIDEATTGRQGGFGSVKVEVTVGTITWQTSLFPSKQHESYVLPIKKQVRTSQALVEGRDVPVHLRVVASA